MTKLFALAAALTLAFSTSISTAQAGMRVGVGIGVGGLAIGALGAMANSAERSEAREYRERKKARAARREREEKAPTRTAKKSKTEKSEKSEVAEKRPADETTNEASSIAAAGAQAFDEVMTGSTEPQSQAENSSIALTSLDEPAPVKATNSVETASQATKSLDCKKFFPSVGMTLSVPCE